jgi:autotransporter adhesin
MVRSSFVVFAGFSLFLVMPAFAQSLPSIYTEDGCSTSIYCSDGTDAQSFGLGSLAAGSDSTASGYESVAGGNASEAYGANAYALADGSVALGQGAEVSEAANGGVAIGQGAIASTSGSVALGDLSNTDGRTDEVSVGSASVGLDRQIANVAAGTENTDAVNLGQMNTGLSDVLTEGENYTNAAARRIQRQAYAGIAAALAKPSMPPLQVGQKGFSLGWGQYGGQTALGASWAYQATRRVSFQVTANSSVQGGPIGLSGQVNYVW